MQPVFLARARHNSSSLNRLKGVTASHYDAAARLAISRPQDISIILGSVLIMGSSVSSLQVVGYSVAIGSSAEDYSG